MSKLNWIACLILTFAVNLTANAESRCPGNVASLPYRLFNRHQAIVPVSVNDRGTYSFLLDTGTQITILDRDLASELGLKMGGRAALISATVNDTAARARIDKISAGPWEVSNLKVVVYGVKNLRAAGIEVRGVLGEDFLEQFDVLIDNTHHRLCLDDSGALRAAIKGSRVPLLDSDSRDDQTSPKPLIVSARLSDGQRPVRLKLDSGANVSFLYRVSDYMALGLFRGASLTGGGVDGIQHTVTELPPQVIEIGHTVISRVPFVTWTIRKDERTSDFDGLLATGVLRSLFIDHQDHFVVLDPI